jgi:hypothetical protein
MKRGSKPEVLIVGAKPSLRPGLGYPLAIPYIRLLKKSITLKNYIIAYIFRL